MVASKNPISTTAFEHMRQAAKVAATRAYCQYSQFPVGASLLLNSDEVVMGCNVENVSFGLTVCAERTAIGSALAKGVAPSDMCSMMIYMPGETFHSPCGACRQVLKEFLPSSASIFSTCDLEGYKEWTLAALLPESFTF